MTLVNLPMPPTSNQAYATNFATKTRFKTREVTKYEIECMAWAQVNRSDIRLIKEHLELFEKDKLKLHIERQFYFPTSKVYSKEGKLKKLDVTNRIKLLDDFLAKILEVDDAHFFSGSEEKLIAEKSLVNIYIDIIK